jgi:hypothetical protein
VTTRRGIATAIGVAMLALLPPLSARADGDALDSPEAAQRDFGAFCREWITKLDSRERHNLARAAQLRRGNQVVLVYTGYGDAALSCETRATGVAESPFLGKLVYYEQRLRKAGASRSAALEERAQVLREIEVIEFFHYDGDDWRY